jgi:hypothetical protein
MIRDEEAGRCIIWTNPIDPSPVDYFAGRDNGLRSVSTSMRLANRTIRSSKECGFGSKAG